MGKRTVMVGFSSLLLVVVVLYAVFGHQSDRFARYFSTTSIATRPGVDVWSSPFAVTDRDLNGRCEIPKDRCSFGNPLPALSENPEISLRKLSAFQHFCGSSFSGEMMVFAPFPTDSASAADYAESLAKTLASYSSAGVVPIVLIEPTNDNGMVSLAKIADGTYDKFVRRFFLELKSHGVTDDTIGVWIPYPEANTPSWNREGFVETTFPKMATTFFASLHEVFPKAKTGILLNSRSYDPADVNWERPRSDDFSAYLDGISKRSVDLFAIQGFPWLPPKGDDSDPMTDPSDFLQPDHAVIAAKELGVSSVWVHSGTFRTVYAGTKESVFVSGSDRERILRDILVATERIQRESRTDVVLSLFASDKSTSDEATDWSYDLGSGSEDSFLRDVIREAMCGGIRVSVFADS